MEKLQKQNNELSELCAQLEKAKEVEANAKMDRVGLEARLVTLTGIPQANEGTTTLTPEGYKVSITGNIYRKVDGDLLQQLARENGLEDHLQSLFRWKPEIELSRWKAADPKITAPLAAAITSTPGKQTVKLVRTEPTE